MNEEIAQGLLERSRDDRVHSAVWDFREGKATWSEVLREDAVRRELQQWYAEELEEQASLGHTPERLRERLVDAGIIHQGRSGSA